MPKANVLGEVGKGYKVAIETLNEGRIGIGAQMIGLAQGALDHAARYTQERKQFGKAIAEFQAVQHQIARAATELEAARLMVYNAARLRDAGQPFLTEAAMCKLFSSEVAERVTSLAVNLLRRLRLREGLPGREAVSRREDRPDLRRHVQPAAADDRQASASGEAALAQVADADLHTLVDPDANSIAIIVKHVAGNLRSRFADFLTTDGESPTGIATASSRYGRTSRGDPAVVGIGLGGRARFNRRAVPDDLDRTITIGGEPFLVIRCAINRSRRIPRITSGRSCFSPSTSPARTGSR